MLTYCVSAFFTASQIAVSAVNVYIFVAGNMWPAGCLKHCQPHAAFHKLKPQKLAQRYPDHGVTATWWKWIATHADAFGGKVFENIRISVLCNLLWVLLGVFSVNNCNQFYLESQECQEILILRRVLKINRNVVTIHSVSSGPTLCLKIIFQWKITPNQKKCVIHILWILLGNVSIIFHDA